MHKRIATVYLDKIYALIYFPVTHQGCHHTIADCQPLNHIYTSHVLQLILPPPSIVCI